MTEFKHLNTILYGPAGTGKTHKMQEIFGVTITETTKNSKPVSIPAKAPIEATQIAKLAQVFPPTPNNLGNPIGKGWDKIGGFHIAQFRKHLFAMIFVNNGNIALHNGNPNYQPSIDYIIGNDFFKSFTNYFYNNHTRCAV